jgi:hypothetical protein
VNVSPSDSFVSVGFIDGRVSRAWFSPDFYVCLTNDSPTVHGPLQVSVFEIQEQSLLSSKSCSVM